MKATVYLSRKLLNQLKVKETESKDLMLTHNLHNIIINGLCSFRRRALALSFLGRSANGTHRSRVGNHRQACCLFRRGFDQRGMRRLCREQHITIGEVTQHG